jgi:SAM-dependent methyltransferase
MPQSIDQCRLCGHGIRTVMATAPGYRSGLTYTIKECDHCQASFAAPLEADDSLYELIYANIQSVPGYNRYFEYAREVMTQRAPIAYLSGQEESYWAVASHLAARRKAGDEPTILEVGCGMGYFTHALRRAGFTATGIDLSAQAVAWGRKQYGPWFECTSLHALREAGQRFDVVVMNQLIEHIPDIHPFVAEALSLLTPTGELLLTTPNKSAYPDGEWETELPPVHLWWFGEASMAYIAKHHDCTVEFVDFTPFYAAQSIVRSPATSLATREPVFDADGRLRESQKVSARPAWRSFLERAGLLRVLRRAKKALLGNATWQGASGPICACILRPGQVPHE